ncbi:expressed unknown protein [Seminavis robusta]|uniref:MYND-type domain-containing protein n=1 Tax=Seminavis robusta TaxID=568900 RepID=A0A9N8HNA4_9STRA|nr:expressed unknown protein [Seminavis robusta]|eukprot:Sro970_g226330.1 n/a (315) ;mRNA; f:17333-18277
MPWPLEKEFLLSLGIAEELPVLWSTLKVCPECFSPEAQVVCEDCRCVRYCSEECQSDHQHKHQAVCSKLSRIQFAEWDDLDLKGPEVVCIDKEKEGEKDTANESSSAAVRSISSEDIMLLTQQCLQNEVDPSDLAHLPNGGPQTLKEAMKLLQSVASHCGDPNAQFGMALLATRAQKDDEALRWTRSAAKNGLADAQVRYAMTYWFDGTADHTVDLVQSILWLRKALAQGKSGLSTPSFHKAANMVRMMANQYYNTMNRLEMKQRGIGFQREMKLVADCGIIQAINMVWLVHSKGDWYENFFTQIEQEKDVNVG